MIGARLGGEDDRRSRPRTPAAAACLGSLHLGERRRAFLDGENAKPISKFVLSCNRNAFSLEKRVLSVRARAGEGCENFPGPGAEGHGRRQHRESFR